MRFIYVKLVGYIGIYNGLGKSELEIDFRNAKNKITVISGPNGCGKSTLLNALNLLPDSNDCFVPSMNASKQLRIYDEGVVYDILMNHPLDNHGNRATTKISIKKNGVELNSNGNVTSYKDIIFNEFDLDSNYITLSHLSSNDRGLADKKPGERKKFIANISSTLDVYNNIHKVLNKKANIYNSYIKNLSGKINNIGDENYLRTTISSLNSRQKQLQDQIESIKSEIIEQKTLLVVNDPNGTMQQEYNTLENQYNKSKSKAEKSFSFFSDYVNSIGNKEDAKDENSIRNKIQDFNNLLQKTVEVLNEKKSDRLVVISQLQSLNESQEKIKVRLDKLKQEVNSELDSQLEYYNNKINQINSEFANLGIGDIEQTSADEIRHIIKILDDIVRGVDVIYESINEAELPQFISIYQQGFSKVINDCNKEIESCNNMIQTQTNEIGRVNSILDKLKVIDKRPKKCNIDDCPFVVDATNILKSDRYAREKLEDELKERSEDLSLAERDKLAAQKLLETYQTYVSTSTILDGLRTEIVSNIDLIKKLSITVAVSDFNVFLDYISKGYRFNSIRDINRYLYMVNDITEYKSYISIRNNLLSEQKANRTNLDTMKEYQQEYENNQTTISILEGQRDKLDKELQVQQSLVDNINSKVVRYNKLLELYLVWKSDDDEYNTISNQLAVLKEKFKSSATILDMISSKSNQLVSLQRELDPIEQQKKTIDSQITLLDQYHKEYAEYKEKFDIVDKLKKYSSPVSGGIQTLFMNLYMSKTLNLANELLGMIFGGQYHLLDYVINENEFRMPFIGNGLEVDDISNGSSAQVSIMGMIINLVLLHQSSDRFNITRLDEVDAALDSSNRGMFVDILQRVVQILNIDQLFIISHSCETALTNVDSIILAPIPGFEDELKDTNIIYSY